MARRILSFVVIAGLVLGVSMFAAPSLGRAGTISCITVANTAAAGGNVAGFFTGQFGGPSAGCPGALGSGNTWNTAAPIVIPEGNFLILTQNPNVNPPNPPLTGTAAYNFDTTDKGTGSGSVYRIFINQPVSVTPPGGGIIDTSSRAVAPAGSVLNFGGVDNSGFTTNEANEWSLIGTFVLPGGTFRIWAGYADNLHTEGNLCLDANGNCVPDNIAGATWGANSATSQFIGGGAAFLGAPFTGHTGTNPCTATSGNTCFDAGALLIQEVPRVPEPSSALLLGVGLMGVAAYGRMFLRKKS